MTEVWNSLLLLGIERYTILLILALPVVATVVGIARHFIGLKTLSIYAPIVLTYAFLELSFDRSTDTIHYLDGLKYGIVLFLLVFATSTFTYKFIKPLRLHYYPKMALIFSVISAAILLTIALGGYLGRTGFTNVNIFSVVLISAITERIVGMYAKTNFKNAFFTSIETLLLTIINYSLISYSEFQRFIFESPWILLIVVLINLLVGRFTGLRLREYIRFWDILDRDYSEENGTNKGHS